MNKDVTNDFLATEKLSVLMRKYSIPCIISLLVAALYNIVDQIFIANADYLGSYGNAANSSVFPLTVLALAIATMAGDGCCTFVSIRLGRGESDDAHKNVGSTIIFVIALSVALAAIYLIGMNPILRLFGADVNAETFSLSREYLFYLGLGIPFYMFGQAMNPIIRSDGSPGYAMMSLLVGAIINLILDPIFIFVCKWGMMGAAVATVAGQVVAAIMAVIYLFKMKAVRLKKSSMILRPRLLRESLPLGFPSFLVQLSVVFSMAAVLNMCSKYGAMDPIFGQEQYAQIPTAVVGIVMKFFQIIIEVSVGLSAGCIPVVGYNIGAGKKKRAARLLYMRIAAEAIVGFAATLIFEFFPNQLIMIFGATNESVYYTEFAVRCIRIFLCLTTFACVNKGIIIYLQAMGKAKFSTLLSLIREILFGVGLVLILPVIFGLDGILYFMPIADCITFIIAMLVVRHIVKELKKA